MKRPYAKDGTTIDENCRYKDGLFRIGAKGEEIKVRNLCDAINQLRDMKVARWRRPSATSSKPGIVTAVYWK